MVVIGWGRSIVSGIPALSLGDAVPIEERRSGNSCTANSSDDDASDAVSLSSVHSTETITPVSPGALPSPRRIFWGYLPSWTQLTVEQVPWKQLTDVSHAFAAVDPDGRVSSVPGIATHRLVRAAHDHGVRIHLAIGGAGSHSLFDVIVRNETVRQRFVESLLLRIEQQNYDGVDIDWEFPTADTSAALARLLHDLRSRLDSLGARLQRKIQLGIAVPGSHHNGQWFDAKSLTTCCDTVQVMAYDFSGPWSERAFHHASLHADPTDPARQWRAVERAFDYWHTRREIPRHSILMGIPLYGRIFAAKRPGSVVSRQTPDSESVVTYSRIPALVNQGWQRWDSDSKQSPWLQSPDGVRLLAFDDEHSVAGKAEFAKAHQCGGLFFWALGNDRLADGRNHLVETARQAWPESTQLCPVATAP